MIRPLSCVAVVLLIACGLPGCTSEPIRSDRYYRLSMPPVDASPDVAFTRRIVVMPVEAQGVLAERGLLYRSGDEPALQRYPAQQWSEPPAVMLSQAIADRLSALLGDEQVYVMADRARPDLVVRSRLRRMESVGSAERAAAELAIDFVVSDADGVLFSHSFSARQAVTPPDIAEHTRVLSTLLARACDELAARIVAEVPATPPAD